MPDETHCDSSNATIRPVLPPRQPHAPRDWWDKASIISGFVSSVVIALIGILISFSIQRAQLISAQKTSEAQITIARLKAEDDRRLQEGQLAAQLVQHLVSKEPREREIAIVALRQSVPAATCEKIVAIVARTDDDPNVRARAIEQLSDSVGLEASKTLAQIAHDVTRPAHERTLAASSSLEVAARQAIDIPRGGATFLLASTTARGTALDRSPFAAAIMRGIAGDADGNRDASITGTELGLYVDRAFARLGPVDRLLNQEPIWVTRGSAEVIVGPIATLKHRYRKIEAVVVGGTGSPAIPKLPATSTDVRSIAVFLNVAGIETTLLTERGATKAAVLSAFKNAAAAVGPDDLFIFYYGGYAQTSVDGAVTWFLADSPAEYLTVTDINYLLDQVPTRSKVVFVDSCNAGAITR